MVAMSTSENRDALWEYQNRRMTSSFPIQSPAKEEPPRHRRNNTTLGQSGSSGQYRQLVSDDDDTKPVDIYQNYNQSDAAVGWNKRPTDSISFSSQLHADRPGRHDFVNQENDQIPDFCPPKPRENSSHMTTMSDFIGKAGGNANKTEGNIAPYGQLERHRPYPLDLQETRRFGQLIAQRRNIEISHEPVSSAEGQISHIAHDAASSVYTDDGVSESTPAISPLYVLKRTNTFVRGSPGVMEPYHQRAAASTQPSNDVLPIEEKKWLRVASRSDTMSAPDESTPPSALDSPPARHPGRIGKSATLNDVIEPVGKSSQGDANTPFSPLTPYLVGGTHARKTSKTLFGQNGWLENTATDTAANKQETQKGSSLFGNIKKKAREIAGKADFKQQHRSSTRPIAKVSISLNPREQSLLYCELEYNLTTALDTYIKAQLNTGRLNPDKLKKVADSWARWGRPRVVGFRYDLETQLDLVAAHAPSSGGSSSFGAGGGIGSEFRFYGPRQTSEVAVRSILQAVQANARAMRVRTFCHPDPIVAKHILEGQALLELLGSPQSIQLALAEIQEFFKIAVQRERQRHEETRKQQEERGIVMSQSVMAQPSFSNPASVSYQDHGHGTHTNAHQHPPSQPLQRTQYGGNPPPRPPPPPVPRLPTEGDIYFHGRDL